MVEAVVRVGSSSFKLGSLGTVGVVVVSVVGLHVDRVGFAIVVPMPCVHAAVDVLHLEEVGPCAVERRRFIQIVVHSKLLGGERWVLEVVGDGIASRDHVPVDDVPPCVVILNELLDVWRDHLVALVLALDVDVRSSELFERPVFEFVHFVEVVHRPISIEFLLQELLAEVDVGSLF